MKQPKELQTRGHITMTTINLKTGERRQLSDTEVAEKMQKILEIPPAERIRMSIRHVAEQQS